MADRTIEITKGQITYDAEGNNIKGSRYYSRVIQTPQSVYSGVTLGRGYDMGGKSKEKIYSDMIRIGLSGDQAKTISKAARLKGSAATKFVVDNKTGIGEITEAQQVKLFNVTYPYYEDKAKKIYDNKTKDIPNRLDFDKLDSTIKDVVVDIVYQGFKGTELMKVAAKNDKEKLAKLIKDNKSIYKYEKNRNRIDHLEK